MAKVSEGIEVTGAVVWEIEKQNLLVFLQEQVIHRLGDSCPAIVVDLIHRSLHITEPLTFVGGKAELKPESIPTVEQIQKSIQTIYECIDLVNDRLEAQGRARSFEMLHLRVEGHVHMGKKSTIATCEAISQDRAEAIVTAVVDAGIPRRYLHPQGYGATCPHPSGDTALNRRVEIHVMSEQEVLDFVSWKFKKYDVDNSGFLDQTQATQLALDMGKTEAEITKDIADMDEDGDGQIEEAELIAWFTSARDE